MVFGLSVSNLLLGLIILYAFIILRSLFSRFVIAAIKRLVKKSETTIDDLILTSVEGPIKMLPIIMGATQFIQQKMTPSAGDPSV